MTPEEYRQEIIARTTRAEIVAMLIVLVYLIGIPISFGYAYSRVCSGPSVAGGEPVCSAAFALAWPLTIPAHLSVIAFR